MAMTLDDVASAAGVSKATVSRVINRRGNVSEATVRRVREAMEQTQFKVPEPKPLRSSGQSSAAQRRASAAATPMPPGTIAANALLVPELNGDLYVSLLHGFEAACQQRGRKTIVCNTQDNVLKQADDILHLVCSGVGGIAIVPVGSAPTPAAHLAILQKLGVPAVLLHRDVPGADAPLIALPLRKIGFRAGQELLDRGHRRIAFLATEGSTSAGTHRQGLEDALGRAGVVLPEANVGACAGAIPLSIRTLESSVAAHVERVWSLPDDQRPTAVYVPSNVIAEVLYLKLVERGLRVGVDVSIVTFGASERTGPINSRLSSIVVDEYQIGRSAVDLLEPGGVDAGNRIFRNVELSFFDGESLGPPPA